jgi:hypothetical protein
MSLINLAREAASKRDSEINKQKQLQDLHENQLQVRLVKLKALVLEEVRQLDQEECQYGKLVVHVTDEFNSRVIQRFWKWDTVGQMFANITIPSSDDNLLVLELLAGIDVGEHKYSDESDPVPYEDPTVWVKIYSPTRQGFGLFSCTDLEGSAHRLFDELGQRLSEWF